MLLVLTTVIGSESVGDVGSHKIGYVTVNIARTAP